MLAAVHAARTDAIRALLLDDVDLGNRRLAIAGRTRPIDEFSHQILLEWLDYRRSRWPSTANPHLLINQMSAHGTRPVSTIYFGKKLRGQNATLERLRVDGNSKKLSPTAPTRSTSPPSSASTSRPPSATPRTPARSSPPRSSGMPAQNTIGLTYGWALSAFTCESSCRGHPSLTGR